MICYIRSPYWSPWNPLRLQCGLAVVRHEVAGGAQELGHLQEGD